MNLHVNELLQPCLVKELKNLERFRSGWSPLSWLYGEFIIELREVSYEPEWFDEDSNPIDHYYDLTVYEANNRSEPFLDISKPVDWTWGRLQSFIIEKSQVTVASLTKHVINKSAVYYKPHGNGYVMCDEVDATWVSLPSGEQSNYLPMGYPLIFVELELSSLTREFSGKTPDMCADVDDFFRFWTPEMIIMKHHIYDSSSSSHSMCSMQRTIKLGEDIYSVFYKSGFDGESNSHEEKWEKNGVLHRVSGPAKMKVFNPGIPSEGHLAEATESWYENGKLLTFTDNTDETIISQWPRSQQEYFGHFAA